MKIIIPLLCYKRADILKQILQNLEKVGGVVKDRYGYQLIIYFSIVKDDPDYDSVQNIVNKYSGDKKIFKTLENKPLGNRMNHLLRHALNDGFDYIMNLGSDDLIHYKLFDIYKPQIDKGRPLFGIGDIYFHNTITNESILYKSYNGQLLPGAGRMIGFKIVKKVIDNLGYFYNYDLNVGLDSNSANNMSKFGYEGKMLRTDEPYIIDLKSKENIHKFQKLKRNKHSKELLYNIVEVFNEM